MTHPTPNTQAEPTLLPCPMCGSTNIKIHMYGETAPGEPDGFGQCHDCSTCGPSGKTEEEAIAAWNRRTPPAPPAADVAGLVADIKSAVDELANGARYPDLHEAIDKLAALAQPKQPDHFPDVGNMGQRPARVELPARLEPTCVGARIKVFGVEVPGFPIGTMHDAAKQAVCDAINRAALSAEKGPTHG